VKLAYASPWLHHSGGTVCEPVDVPVNKRHLDMVYAHIRYSDKPFMGSVTAEERAEDSIAMARLRLRRGLRRAQLRDHGQRQRQLAAGLGRAP
jgi:trimethylamine:corrinoid methyltransferase-like protein